MKTVKEVLTKMEKDMRDYETSQIDVKQEGMSHEEESEHEHESAHDKREAKKAKAKKKAKKDKKKHDKEED